MKRWGTMADGLDSLVASEPMAVDDRLTVQPSSKLHSRSRAQQEGKHSPSSSASGKQSSGFKQPRRVKARTWRSG
jgi:hypothetical protein